MPRKGGKAMMTDYEYNDYLDTVKNIIEYGTKENLEHFYKLIITVTNDWDNVRRMDRLHNDRWIISWLY